MPDTPDFLSKRLSDDGEKTARFFQELNPGQLETTIYTEGACWNLTQVLMHLAATEASLYQLVDNIGGGGQGSPEDFDIDRYNERKVASMPDLPVADLVALFQERRKKMIELVANLSQDDLERQGRHPFLGMTQLSEIIKIIYRHNQIHIREIRKALE
jgi:hypothetical protein